MRPKLKRKFNHVSSDWDELVEIYFHAKSAEGLAATTLQTRREYLKLYSAYFAENFPGTKPHEASTNEIRQFIQYLRNDHVKYRNNNNVKDQYKTKGLSPSYINSVVKILKAMFNFWLAENYIERNSMATIKMLKEPRDTVQALELSEVRKLLKEPNKRTYAGFRDYVMIMLLIDTGLRIGEVVSLTVDDVCFKTNTKAPKDEYRLPKSLSIQELEMLREACETVRQRAFLEVLYATGCRLSEVYGLNKADINQQNMGTLVIGKGDKQREIYFFN